MIKRALQDILQQRLTSSDKVIILYGPRQVGKTTLVRELLTQVEGRKLEINADLMQYAQVLSSRDLGKLKGLTAGYDIIFIDEAQRIPEIGINLKILHDHLPHLKLVVTGSSSLDLASKVREPLTGRTWSHHLYPISLGELAATRNRFELDVMLEELLLFGAYPAIFSIENFDEKRAYLTELTNSYLYKDVLELGNIRNAPKMRDLLRLLAYQIGSEVSINELSNKLELHRDAVINYIDLLEKAFVIFRLSGYNRNLRKEISRHDKIFFWDLGVRNALIENFSPLENRSAGGNLWENFLIAERIKSQAYKLQHANRYFWRTYTGAELDYVEERDGMLRGFEFKFSQKTAKPPTAWMNTYPNSAFMTINKENYFDFLIAE
ncbi:MAG: ATP-binding protein [Saprospiraceae bacterium]|nr:ATP-binding protein [Saprospiraceae bacterium]